MKLRSKATSNTKQNRRTVRLALALAISGNCLTSAWAQTLPALPSLPSSAPHASTDDQSHALLPYPFAGKQACSEAAQPAKQMPTTSAPTAQAQRIVEILGLCRHSDNDYRQAFSGPVSVPRLVAQVAPSNAVFQPDRLATADDLSGSNHSSRNKFAFQPIEEGETNCEVNGSQPPAVELGDEAPSSIAGQLPLEAPKSISRQSALAIPNLPQPLNRVVTADEVPSIVMPASTDLTQGATLVQTAAVNADSPVGVVREVEIDSLIDISIPLTLDNDRLPSSAASMTRSKVPAKSVSTTMRLSDSEREPEIVRSSERLSLSDREGAESKEDLEQPFDSLGNTEPITTDPHGIVVEAPRPDLGPSRSAQLHRSSASSWVQPLVVQPSGAPRRSSPMQVRIEGEGAPMIAASRMADFTPGLDQPPMPMFSGFKADRSPDVQPAMASSEMVNTSAMPAGEPAAEMRVKSPLAMAIKDIASVTTGSTIEEVSVENPEIVQLVKSGSNSISVIGLKSGTTRIALVTRDDSGGQEIEVREVRVGSGSANSVSMPQLADEISQTVRHLYPNSEIEVIAFREHLVVKGFTAYENDAKKIVSLVRKTSLVPVLDQVETTGK